MSNQPIFTHRLQQIIRRAISSLGVAVALTAFLPCLHAAPPDAKNKPVPSAFGFVDMGKVANNSKLRQKTGADLQALNQRMIAAGRRVIQNGGFYLPAAEIKELAYLYVKTTPTPAEQKRINELEAKCTNFRREVIQLQNTPAPTAVQTTRMTALSEAKAQGDAAIKALDISMGDEMAKKSQEAEYQTLGQIKKIIAKVAKSKKLSVVFTGKDVMYGAVDITEDVVKEVSK